MQSIERIALFRLAPLAVSISSRLESDRKRTQKLFTDSITCALDREMNASSCETFREAHQHSVGLK